MSLTSTPFWDIIKEYRSRKSRELKIPAYCIFSDAIIDALCKSPPQNSQMLLDIKGIGKTKLEKYGQDILELCRDREPIAEPNVSSNDTPANTTEVNEPEITAAVKVEKKR